MQLRFPAWAPWAPRASETSSSSAWLFRGIWSARLGGPSASDPTWLSLEPWPVTRARSMAMPAGTRPHCSRAGPVPSRALVLVSTPSPSTALSCPLTPSTHPTASSSALPSSLDLSSVPVMLALWQPPRGAEGGGHRGLALGTPPVPPALVPTADTGLMEVKRDSRKAGARIQPQRRGTRGASGPEGSGFELEPGGGRRPRWAAGSLSPGRSPPPRAGFTLP